MADADMPIRSDLSLGSTLYSPYISVGSAITTPCCRTSVPWATYDSFVGRWPILNFAHFAKSRVGNLRGDRSEWTTQDPGAPRTLSQQNCPTQAKTGLEWGTDPASVGNF